MEKLSNDEERRRAAQFAVEMRDFKGIRFEDFPAAKRYDAFAFFDKRVFEQEPVEVYVQRQGHHYDPEDFDKPPRRWNQRADVGKPGGRRVFNQVVVRDDKKVFLQAYRSISASTRKGYESWMRLLQGYGCELSLRGICDLLSADVEQQFTRPMIDGMRKAVKHLWTCSGVEVPAIEEKLLKKVETSYIRDHPGEDQPVRGAITPRQFGQLLSVVNEGGRANLNKSVHWKFDSVGVGILFQFAFGLRISQVQKMTRGDFSIDEKQDVLYVGERLKTKTVDQLHEEVEKHPVMPELRAAVRAVLRKMDARNSAATDKIAPFYLEHFVNRIIRFAAEVYDWEGYMSGELSYSSHSLRHGAASYIYRVLGYAAARDQLAHKGVKTTQVYVASNEERMREAERGAQARRERADETAGMEKPPQPGGAEPKVAAAAPKLQQRGLDGRMLTESQKALMLGKRVTPSRAAERSKKL